MTLWPGLADTIPPHRVAGSVSCGGGGYWLVSLYLAFYVRYMMTDMWNMTDFCIFVYNKTAIEYVGNDKI